jgi:GTP pyrophosphokinase
MPAGCTALDFAFSIHTFLGSHCIGAKVNHKLVPLSHKLQSGDQVEILTSKSQHIQPAWINFVSSAKAKAKIQAILRRKNRESQKKGEELLTDFLAKESITYTTNIADQLATFHDMRKREDFLQAVAEKSIILGNEDIDELNGKHKSAKSGWRRYVPFISSNKQKEEDKQTELFVVPEKFNRKKPIYITDENIRQYKFPRCCHPIPGDDILGFIDNKNRIEIHKRTCPVANKLKTSYGNRILDAKWNMHKKLFFDAIVRMEGIDRMGILVDISRVITSQMNVNIRRLTIEGDDGVFNGTAELRIHDRDDVKAIIDNLKKIEGMQTVTQIE